MNLKFIVYQQGARGLGRISRSLKLCRTLLNGFDKSTGIILACDHNIFKFNIPDNLDVVILPSVAKGNKKQYYPKKLNLQTSEVLKLRSYLILTLIKKFKPDFLFVDNTPSGIENELLLILKWIKENHVNTKLVFISRDILDTPEKIRKEWAKYNTRGILEKYYNKILIIGNKKVFDYINKYNLSPELKFKTHYCNYFPVKYLKIKNSSKYDILITVGGGVDGDKVIDIFLETYNVNNWKYRTKIIFGPELPKSFYELNLRVPSKNIVVSEFSENMTQEYLKSHIIICMGGSNTLMEIIACGKKPLVIPRTYPTQEQHIRADSLAKLGLVNLVNKYDSLSLKQYVVDFVNRENELYNECIPFDANEKIIKNLSTLL